jgi:hypothetical protein
MPPFNRHLSSGVKNKHKTTRGKDISKKTSNYSK